MNRTERLKKRLFEKDFYTKIEWWGQNETILTSEEIKKEPLAIRRAYAVQHTLRCMPAKIKEDELIVGIANLTSCGFGREFPEYALPEEKEEAMKAALTVKQLGGLHPGDYAKVLRLGVKGIKDEIYAQIEKELQNEHPDEDKMIVWRSMSLSLDGVVSIANRYADLCIREIENTDDPRRKKELLEIARICRKVPEYPAESYHEALQSFWMFYLSLHSCMEIIAAGRTDQVLYPYYKADIESGKITKEYAEELTASWLIKFCERVQMNKKHWEPDHSTPIDEALAGNEPDNLDFFYSLDNRAEYNFGTSANHWMMNMILGGQTREGKDATNELSYMILEQWNNLDLISPVMSVRIHKGTPQSFIDLCSRVLIHGGDGEPTIYNDETVIAGLVESGVPIEDARGYSNDGCWEVLIPGKTNYVYEHVHAVLCMEYLFNHGRSLVRDNRQEAKDIGEPSQFKTFDEFYDAFMDYVITSADDVVTTNVKYRSLRSSISPSCLLSTIMDDCIARGKDIFTGGSHYTFYGLYITGFSHCVDSLAAIKKLVYEEKRVSMEELTEAIRTDYAGKEPLRQMMINDAPKYGNDDKYVDDIAKKFMADFAAWAKKRNTYDDIKNSAEPGFTISCANGTFEHYHHFGRDCGASADGRHYMDTFASNYSPSLGADKNGPTAVIKSATHVNTKEFYSGGPVDIAISGDEFEGPKGPDRMSGLIESFCKLGGALMTLQCMNPDVLRDAQVHPENHKNLRVRLGGLNAYFIALPKAQQDIIIRRAKGRSV